MNMSNKQTKEYAETKHNKNMPEKKAEIVFNKLAADMFEERLDNQTNVLLSKVDRHNKAVKEKSLEGVGKSTGVGAGVGAAAGAVYPFIKRDGTRKFVRNALKGGGIGAAIGALAGGAYIAPKAYDAFVTRGEERRLRNLLDHTQDQAREMRIRRGAQQMKNYYETKQDS